jgi:signal transduction histidine kinase
MTKIMIIEDESELREEVEEILKFKNYDVVSASNGKEGFEKIMNNIPDLILCDILMPEMNGFELFENLKKNSYTSNIPFIFITALNDRKNLRKGMESGADDYLVKPFTGNELLNTVETRLKKSRENQLQIEKLKESLAVSIPHELRTPLNGILGFSKIISDNCDTLNGVELREMADAINESGERLYELIRKYLMFIEVELNKEKQAVSPIKCSYKSIVKVAKKIAHRYNREGDLVFQVNDFIIRANEQWFHFALNELIDNAFKFSAPGQPVSIQAELKTDFVELTIRDEGTGFPERSIEKINAFVQFDRKILEQQGIGLGLFLSKRIVLLENGDFQILSSENRGTVIKIKLPSVTD